MDSAWVSANFSLHPSLCLSLFRFDGESLFVSHGLWEEPTHRIEAS